MTGSGLLIAVDGGGSKTDVVAFDRKGTIHARIRAGGSSPHLEGLAQSVATLVGAIREACAGMTASNIDAVHIYLSGLDLPIEITEFRHAFTVSAPEFSRNLVVKNDLFAVLRAGTEAEDAVAVICGSGTNCIGVRRDGAEVTYASLGMISGDWGGGFGLGETALWFAARSEDGRGEPTALQSWIPRYFERNSVAAVTEAIHRGELDRGRLIELVPGIFDLTDAGDEVARSIITRQADEIVTTAVTTMKRLGLGDTEVPVIIGGGVVSGKHPVLIDRVESELARRVPAANLSVITTAPVTGAALLALDAEGASADAHVALISALDESAPRGATVLPFRAREVWAG
ncbi:N-acetylglucosamine kinase [Paramicrobacterium chengjingii]|uniref:N-acetylglucosamine kinase n=1 Tax=Paramicrobacterium chengjingii TaxID=2769067 RepID=A0ABX6YGJ2_9MICO|nr:BadF/BadG/BcrA/BcrD ATPase family protein [Microbacterium chengjingii]QPZ37805.1 N-acetylglucosamine kinase [Microbacterium chengjingii]